MGKRILALILMAVMMLTMGAQAVDTFAVKDTISLSFDGTTAICSATCKGSNTDDKVKATLTLVSEGKTVASWSASDKLAKYMVDNGYATAESYLDTNAGNFATKPGHSVLVTINNTVDVCYTAHNTNRKDAAFTNTELNSTYTFYVIKNY